VSRQALEQAGAIDEDVEPVTIGTRIKQGTLVALVVIVVGGGFLWWRSSRAQSARDQAADLAQPYVASKGDKDRKLTHEAAAEIHRALGEYYSRLHTKDSVDPVRLGADPNSKQAPIDSVKAAEKQYLSALGALRNDQQVTSERDV